MRYTLSIIALIASTLIMAQTPITISGYLSDSLTGERLIGANVFNAITYKGVSTNNFGYYVFQLHENEIVTVQFSYVGYNTESCVFKLNTDTIVNMQLTSDNSIEQVVVKGEKAREQLAEMSKMSLNADQISRMPNITGEPNLLKVYQLMPGIAQADEGNSGLYVRGGSPDQNLFLLDDVPLYNVMHLGGIYSVFDPAVIKNVTLYKGGFPARYGGRISSIIDVRNKDGNLHKFGGEVGISLLLSKVFLEGPIKKDKASFVLSVRRSNIDLFTTLYNKVLTKSPENTGYYFYDINAKVNLIANQNNRVFISFYKGLDNFYRREKDQDVGSGYDYEGESELKWGNVSASLRWQHVFKNNSINNFTVAYSNYTYANENHYSANNTEGNQNSSTSYSLKSDIKDIIVKSDLQIPIANSDLKAGIELTSHRFNPSAIQYSDKQNDSVNTGGNPNNIMPAFSGAIYLERVFNLLPKLSANLGLRLASFFVSDTSFFNLEPRVIVNYHFAKAWALKASYCHMTQNIHLLSNSNTGLPSDLWVPSTGIISPEQSKQVSLGITHTSANNYLFTAEAYYKTMNNLIEYKAGTLIYSSNQDWTEKIETEGKGYSAGIELMLEKKIGKVTGWISYTLSKSERQFSNIQNGDYFPFKYDQTHNFSFVFNYAISKKLSASLTWQYHTGNAITIAEGSYEQMVPNYYDEGKLEPVAIHVYSAKNGYRMPAYHKLDVGLNYTKPKPNGTAVWHLGIFNVYNRQNAHYLYFKDEEGETKLYQQSLFPIMFNFGYLFQF